MAVTLKDFPPELKLFMGSLDEILKRAGEHLQKKSIVPNNSSILYNYVSKENKIILSVEFISSGSAWRCKINCPVSFNNYDPNVLKSMFLVIKAVQKLMTRVEEGDIIVEGKAKKAISFLFEKDPASSKLSGKDLFNKISDKSTRKGLDETLTKLFG